ncbi:MAG: S-layer homology domain-containing protein, partial [Monoglobaceae bacterium]
VTEIQLKQAYSYANFENELDINDIYKAGRFVNTFIVNCSQELEPELEISINGDTCETSKAADNNTFKWSIDVPVDKSTDEYSVRGRLYSKKYNITLLEIVRDLRFYRYVEFLNIVNDNGSTGEFTASFNAISDLVISYGYDTQLLLKDSSAAIESIKNIIHNEGPYEISEESIPVVIEVIRNNMPMTSINCAKTAEEMQYSVSSYNEVYGTDISFTDSYSDDEKRYFYKNMLLYRDENRLFESNADIETAVEYARQITGSYPAYDEYNRANALTLPRVFEKYKDTLEIDMSYIPDEYRNQTLFVLKSMELGSYLEIPDAMREAYEKAKENKETFADAYEYQADKENKYDIIPRIERQTSVLPNEAYFVDMAGFDWAQEAVEYLYDKSIVNGKSERNFAPYDNVTREEFVKMIVGAFDIAPSDKETDLNDIDGDEWYAPYVNAACSCGIVQGHSDGNFGVGEYITREDVAVILYRTANVKDIKLNLYIGKKFNDADKISDYAQSPVGILYNNEIINGVGEGVFEPKMNANRGEAAVMIYKLLMFGGQSDEN